MCKTKKVGDPKSKAHLQVKIIKLSKYEYVALGIMNSVLNVFSAPNAHGIRPVYNGARSGQNEAIWASWFGLHPVYSQLRGIIPGTFMGDADVGEMFHTFL